MDFHDYAVGPQSESIFTDPLSAFKCHNDRDPDYTDYCCRYCCYNGFNELPSSCLTSGEGRQNPPFWAELDPL